jgi:hypothetical protein
MWRGERQDWVGGAFGLISHIIKTPASARPGLAHTWGLEEGNACVLHDGGDLLEGCVGVIGSQVGSLAANSLTVNVDPVLKAARGGSRQDMGPHLGVRWTGDA